MLAFDERKIIDPFFNKTVMICGDKAMGTHWGIMQAACSKWHDIHEEIDARPVSGADFEQKMRRAVDMYSDETDSQTFNYLNVFAHIENCKKWADVHRNLAKNKDEPYNPDAPAPAASAGRPELGEKKLKEPKKAGHPTERLQASFDKCWADARATPPGGITSNELYIMESFHDIRMVNNRSIVEQGHEIQCIAKELELLKRALPDKFVAGCIIAKLPPSWRNFATTLKHKRQEISVENLIASLDVEEKARAKDTTEKGEGQSSANMVQKKLYSKNKGNNKPSFNKPMKTITFKKKKMINKADLSCFTCGETGHFSKECPERADRKKKARQFNMVIASNADGYGNLFTVVRDSSVLMGNGSHAFVRGVGTVDLKFTSGKIVQLRNVQHVPTMNKNLVSGSLLCRDGFKVVLESNKVVVSKFGQFIVLKPTTKTTPSLYDLAKHTIGTNLEHKKKYNHKKKMDVAAQEKEDEPIFGWANYPLSYEQVHYVALDAHLGFKIARKHWMLVGY
ncbi:hypothetical protein QYE76_034396 [Lolium multiflorum]|uniref:CCHC-type domain-containing protein n=1 Tax=Lolium multiflorum TaxID=4521 RepID=A0AAD8R0Z9_LOLMU|nr:hypothetical protein QYE76_034396 [Lolium multiflorum]